ncbi:MAG: 2,3-diphosphoglycerate synthetase [Thermoleophilia bacterium]|nr:2,3-diphosphoglycerate synthetase [Thermoleophilia bacterium]
MGRAVAVIDGEHYAPVVRDALAEVEHEVVAAVLAGGTEKLVGGEDYGVPLHDDLERALAEHAPDVVLDLSDEPVLSPRQRLLLASRALARGVAYEGPDFRFEPPAYAPFGLPSLAVIGTGKRVGKTAVTGHVARLLARDRDVVVVAMGRGGPAEPELIESPPGVDDLVRLARAGRHAASDHLETAALARVVTVGCRRCGGGLAGMPGPSNVLAGAELAAGRNPELVVFDGSGAAIPPVDVDARVLVAHDVASGLNPYRVLVSDLVLTMSDDVAVGAARLTDAPVLRFDLRLRPTEPLAGRHTAVFTTGPAPVDHLDAELVLVSRNLARRDALRAELEGLEADVFLVEIKAAAVDVVVEAALERGAAVVLADNEVVADGLDEALLSLAPARVRA